MRAAGIIGLSAIGLAWLLFRRVDAVVDEAFGDWPLVPEALAADREALAGGGAGVAADRRLMPSRTHGDGGVTT